MAAARSHLSIGEVLSLLQEEFPDATISKIRFLESQGLVDPERTPSGYRKFYDPDVERLRWVLRQQREHFLPLKVIKDRLAAKDEADAAPPPPRPEPAGSPGPDGVAGPDPADGVVPAAEPAEPESYTFDELVAASGASREDLERLVGFGLVVARPAVGDTAYFDADALAVARLAGRFAGHGVEARHLRAWRTGADREAALFEQVVMPLLRQRNPQSRRQAVITLDELARLGGELREVLVRQALRSVR